MKEKKNNTLIIVLVAIAVLGICCCGGFAIIGNQGFNMVKQVNADNTAVVTDFATRASATWTADSVADQIYSGDGSAQRMEFVQIVFNELKTKGTFTSLAGNTTGFQDNTLNGVRTQTFTWKGTMTLSDGTSPISFEMIKVGETWQVKDIYLQ